MMINYKEQIERLKSDFNPDHIFDAITLFGIHDCIEFLISWKYLNAFYGDPIGSPPKDDDDFINWMWSEVAIDQKQIMNLFKSDGTFHKKFKFFMKNKFIYPDKTINDSALKELVIINQKEPANENK